MGFLVVLFYSKTESYIVAWLSWDKLCWPGWLQTHSGPPTSDSWMLVLNVYTTMSSLIFIFLDNHSDQVKWDHRIVLNYIFLKASDVEQFINDYWSFYFVFWELQLKNPCIDGKIWILSVWFFHFFMCCSYHPYANIGFLPFCRVSLFIADCLLWRNLYISHNICQL